VRFLTSLGRRWQRRQASSAQDSIGQYGQAPRAQDPAASGVKPRGGRPSRPQAGLPSGLRLDEIQPPAGAEERAWHVARAAFEERSPVPRRAKPWRPVLVLAAAAILAAVVASPPGQAVLDSIRESVGIERAQPALFSLPAPGPLLVVSDDGPWIVQPDGSKRLLGRYREASWSPFGRFVVAARTNELAALEPDGDVRWSLGRPGVRFPRWAGSETDTRIAYLSGSTLRVVAGDGTGDRLLRRNVSAKAPAWLPGSGFRLAYTDRGGRQAVVDADTGRAFPIEAVPAPSAVIQKRGASSEVELDGRTVFRGTGAFRDVARSPDGRWLLVTWPTADQFVFVRVGRPRTIVASSAITEQFGGGAFPRIAGWCCEP
jgi:hypothetical protein